MHSGILQKTAAFVSDGRTHLYVMADFTVFGHMVIQTDNDIHIEYCIRIQGFTDKAYTVMRRYSEFTNMHWSVREELEHTGFHCSSVSGWPLLPPAKLCGNMEPEFIELRKDHLNDYICALVKITHVLDCETFLEFIAPETERRELRWTEAAQLFREYRYEVTDAVDRTKEKAKEMMDDVNDSVDKGLESVRPYPLSYLADGVDVQIREYMPEGIQKVLSTQEPKMPESAKPDRRVSLAFAEECKKRGRNTPELPSRAIEEHDTGSPRNRSNSRKLDSSKTVKEALSLDQLRAVLRARDSVAALSSAWMGLGTEANNTQDNDGNEENVTENDWKETGRWEEADKCASCGVTFGLFTRRHHCRHCRRSFCDAHSNQQILLPSSPGVQERIAARKLSGQAPPDEKDGEDSSADTTDQVQLDSPNKLTVVDLSQPQRVCLPCYEKITGEKPEEGAATASSSEDDNESDNKNADDLKKQSSANTPLMDKLSRSLSMVLTGIEEPIHLVESTKQTTNDEQDTDDAKGVHKDSAAGNAEHKNGASDGTTSNDGNSKSQSKDEHPVDLETINEASPATTTTQAGNNSSEKEQTKTGV